MGRPELIEGRLVLRTQLAGFAIPAAQIQAIRLPDPKLNQYPGLPLMRIHLCDGGRITGTIPLRENASGRFRLFGSREVQLPWNALAGFAHRGGGTLVLYDSLENGTDAWRGSGRLQPVRTRAQAGEHALQVPGPKQQFSRDVPALAAGEVECSFYDPGNVARGTWGVRLEFAGEQLTAQLGWSDDSYTVVSSDSLNVAVQRLRRHAGWHRLRIRFGQDGLRCEIDDQLLAQGKRPDKPLSGFTMLTEAAGAAANDLPATFLDDLKIYRAVPDDAGERQHTQDVVFLATGDEVYGQVEQTRSESVTLNGKFGTHDFPLADVQRVALGYHRPAPAVTRGQRVEVSFLSLEPSATVDQRQHDVLSGVLTEINDKQLVLEHSWLGSVAVPRSWVVQIKPLGYGARLELDPGYHHLGNEARPQLRVIEASGPKLELPFDLRLDRLPQGTTWLSLEVEDLEGTDSRHAAELAAGHLRTQVFLNDRLLEGFLNRHVRESRQTIRLPVPQGVLRDGKNLLRIIQKPAADQPGQFDDCGIARLALEIDEE